MNINQIYTGYDKLGERVPKSLYQLISNTKNKNGWLEFETMENIDFTVQGRNAINMTFQINLINERIRNIY